MARITMPQLGETVTEGTVTRWLKAEGDVVETDEPLLEVATDKVETEIPSAFAGVVERIVVGEGDTVPVGSLLAVVRGDGETEEDLGSDAGLGRADESGLATSIAARTFRRSMEGGVGSLYPPLRRHRARRVAHHRGGAAPGPGDSSSRPPAVPVDEREVAERVPFSAIRRLTAAHLTASLHTAAHTLTSVDVDYGHVDAARARFGAAWRAEHGVGLSYLPFIARSVCVGLSQFGRLNASVADDALYRHRHVNLGVAVDLDFEGLIVPVLRHAEALRLPALAAGLAELARRARAHELTGDDTVGGTFTLSNAGAYGTAMTVPIINPPQVAILSTDGVVPSPVAVRDGEGGWRVEVRPVGRLSMSFDHRANDGAYASAFLDAVRRDLQERDWEAELSGRDLPGQWEPA